MHSRLRLHALVLFLFLALGEGPATAQAQLNIARGTLVPSGDSLGRRRMQAWLELQRDPGATTSGVGWDYRLGVLIPLLTVHRSVELLAQAGHEMWAAPRKGLSFDPRAAVWEERLSLAGQTRRGWHWDGGLYWRCRHDIDAIDRADTATSAPTKRIVILSGLQVGASTPEWSIAPRATRLRVQLTGQPILWSDDAREPRNRRVPRWTDARGAWTLTMHAATRGPAGTELHARAWHAMVLFREPQDEWRSNHRLEASLRLAPRTRPVDLLVATERAFDDLLLPAPRSTRAFFLGVRFASHAQL